MTQQKIFGLPDPQGMSAERLQLAQFLRKYPKKNLLAVAQQITDDMSRNVPGMGKVDDPITITITIITILIQLWKCFHPDNPPQLQAYLRKRMGYHDPKVDLETNASRWDKRLRKGVARAAKLAVDHPVAGPRFQLRWEQAQLLGDHIVVYLANHQDSSEVNRLIGASLTEIESPQE